MYYDDGNLFTGGQQRYHAEGVSGRVGMKNLSRVVWSEGMYVGPHHFQAQNRYFEDTIQFSTSSVWYQPFGFCGYHLDAEALRNGTVTLIDRKNTRLNSSH